MGLTRAQKKRFLRIARPRLDKCISCDKRILEKIKEGIRTGKVDERILQMFPDAYPGVMKKERQPDPVLSYFLTEHNQLRREAYKKLGREEYRRCLVVPGRVVGEKEGELVIEGPDGEYTAKKRKGLKKGTKVLVHDGEIVELLSPEEYEKARKMFLKSLNSRH